MSTSHSRALALLGGKKYISLNALEEVLRTLKANPDFTGTSRRSIKRARDSLVDVVTPYGPLIQRFNLKLDAGQEWKPPYVNPAGLLWTSCETSHAFAEFLADRMKKRTSNVQSKWSIMVYADEITPGNPLKHRNPFKTQAI